MFVKRIYRGLPTIVLFIVVAVVQLLAINAFV